MMRISWRAIAAVTLSLVHLGTIAFAQDCDGTAACDSADESAELFFPETSNHPGLLGKAYIDLRYTHIQDDEFAISPGFDDSLQGMILSSNAPLTPLDVLPGPFHYDLYSEFSFALLNGEGNLGPDYGNLDGALDVELNSFGIGLTAFVEVFERVRPFIQVGYLYRRAEVRATIAPVVAIIAESDSTVLLNFGSEFDIAERLAARVAVDINTISQLDDSRATAELIFWPFRKV